MTKPTLLVLAAGIGSRYGGLKQIDPMGPNGETVLDYSIYDAIRAGFGRVLFIIREDFQEAFKEGVGARFAGRIDVDYAFQKLEDLPTAFSVPAGRTKPWGTAHAIWAARHLVNEPFAVINADDFYGQNAYVCAADFFGAMPSINSIAHYALIGYPLINTLSDHGDVNRGICTQAPGGLLTGVEEYVKIQRENDGVVRGNTLAGIRNAVNEHTPVSMNFWLFTACFFEHLELDFIQFLNHYGQLEKSEYYIPSVVDTLIHNGKADCRIITTTSQWFGITYPEDKPNVVESIQKLIASGEYPSSF